MSTDPFALFSSWFAEARNSEPNDPEAMALATADANGAPSVRMVLLKDFGSDGFVFYTNLESAKGRQLAANPRAALLWHWKSLRRQIRVEGAVEPVSDAESDVYFASRPRDAQVGAWASDQSRPMNSREEFEERIAAYGERFEGAEVSRPPRWGGFRVMPRRIEFWRDRPFRLHERQLFEREPDGSWSRKLLFP
jgi:pyridoxamine 5'-phosphate oxidase